MKWLPALFLLCQCASKHQPQEFAPYFPTRPNSQLSLSHLWERQKLQEMRASNGLSPLQVKRFFELSQIELRTLKKQTDRYLEIEREMKELSGKVASLDEALNDLSKENRNYRESIEKTPSKNSFSDAALKKEYLEAQSLWNREENEAAFQKIESVIARDTESLTEKEQYRLQSLRFRIALDIADFNAIESSYQKMKNLESCSEETAQAAFLMALHHFTKKEYPKAVALFESQCDPDRSASNRIKRLYWKARFSEPQDPSLSQKLYEELFQSKMPGYYVYLAKSRLGRKVALPKADPDPKSRPYLNMEFSVPRRVRALFVDAEDRLKNNLLKDASVYLTRAAQILKADFNESHLDAMLYCAHLLQASGSHLEAMKIYALLTTALQEDSPAVAALDMDFLREMFPRPFSPTVEWLSRLWGTDPDFIYAIMRQESAFNPVAVSPADARGLMQLMPFLAKSLATRWGYETYYSDKLLFNAEENLKLATFHLYQLRQLAPHLVLMTAAYNAGFTRLTNWWRKYGMFPMDVFVEAIPVNETRNYVKLVMRNYLYYKALREGGSLSPHLVPFELPKVLE